MSKDITESDLELIQLGNTLGLNLISFAELRSSQEDDFVDRIREKALIKLAKHGDNVLVNTDAFYAGSIDFMVCDEPEGKKFFLLETNGGSNRGLSILSNKQQDIMYNGYFQAIRQAIEKSKGNNEKILVLVGVPVNDALIHEKVIMVEYFRKKIKSMGYSLKIFNTDSYSKEYKAEIVFLIADYKELDQTLTFSNGWIKYIGEKVKVLIGDGIARRFKDEKFINLIKKDFRRINTIIVNPIFTITDDKSLTYLASFFSKDLLKKYNLRYLLFTKAYNEKNLIQKIKYLINNYKRSFIIKPSGGSGGAGVIPILKDEKPENLKHIIKESKREFFAKFMRNRNPYPYTIQEMANFNTIIWKGGKHTYDIRLYLAQNNNQIVPIGGLARIAKGRYSKGLNKQEFVVNLSGYNGQIEVNRGIGFSEKNSKILDLELDDFVNMFCIGCIIFKSIAENYNQIINFSDWDKVIG
jgi:hypothetical protein